MNPDTIRRVEVYYKDALDESCRRRDLFLESDRIYKEDSLARRRLRDHLGRYLDWDDTRACEIREVASGVRNSLDSFEEFRLRALMDLSMASLAVNSTTGLVSVQILAATQPDSKDVEVIQDGRDVKPSGVETILALTNIHEKARQQRGLLIMAQAISAVQHVALASFYRAGLTTTQSHSALIEDYCKAFNLLADRDFVSLRGLLDFGKQEVSQALLEKFIEFLKEEVFSGERFWLEMMPGLLGVCARACKVIKSSLRERAKPLYSGKSDVDYLFDLSRALVERRGLMDEVSELARRVSDINEQVATGLR